MVARERALTDSLGGAPCCTLMECLRLVSSQESHVVFTG